MFLSKLWPLNATSSSHNYKYTLLVSKRQVRIVVPILGLLFTILLIHEWYTAGGLIATVRGRVAGAVGLVPPLHMHPDETFDLPNVRAHLEATLTFVPKLNISEESAFYLPSTYSAVVLYLVSLRHARELILALSSLYHNVPMSPWPIVLFHTGDYNDLSIQAELKKQLLAYISSGSGSGDDIAGPEEWHFVDRLEFIELKWSLPPGVSNDVQQINPVFKQVWPGYHEMSAFFAYHIFSHPRLKDVTYYLRLDEDAHIVNSLCYDPIERAHRRGLAYAFRSTGTDPEVVTHGLWQYIDEYSSSNSFRPTAAATPSIEDELDSDYESSDSPSITSSGETIPITTMLERNQFVWPGGKSTTKDQAMMKSEGFPIYHSNFEVVNLEAFRRSEVKAWLDDLMSDPLRIYKWRWGDAAIRYATVQMFFDTKSEVQEYCDIDYYSDQAETSATCACIPL